jgi:Kef-type K+ transport system membrane component KefB
VGGVRKLVVSLLVLLGIVGIGGSVINARWFNVVLIAVGCLAFILAGLSRWMGDFFEKFAAAFDARWESRQLVSCPLNPLNKV